MATTTNPAGDSKVQQLIEKFGGWAAVALISLVGFMYQGDRANMQASIAALEKVVASQGRSIERVRESKLSKEEFKSAQEVWIREAQGMREDIRDLTKMLQQSQVIAK